MEEESSRSSSPASTIRPNVGDGMPPIGSPLPDGEDDPFPRPTQVFKDQAVKLYDWFDEHEFKKSLFEEARAVTWGTIDIVAQKRLFIHAERRVMTVLRENHILRIQGNMPGASSGISLRAFAGTDILQAEEKGVIYGLEDWDSMVNHQDLGKADQRQIMQVTIVVMAKLYHCIQTQNDVLADQTAEWHLMCAWIDDAQARLAYNPPNQPADELDNLRLGARVLLEGACKIIYDLEQCIQSFKAIKAESIALEKMTKDKYGSLGRFEWGSYDVQTMYYSPVPDNFTDLWCATDQQMRQDFMDMVDERCCSRDESFKKQYRRDFFTRSLAIGAKWIHQVDGQVIELQRLLRARHDAVQYLPK
jgi:hypothetical protein